MVQIKDNLANDQPRRRGRPRKNQAIEKQPKKEIKQNFVQPEKEIILHLPLLMRDLDENTKDNKFTEKEYESDDESQTMLTLSDDDDNVVNNKNYYDVMQELQEKDKLIRQLKDEILEYNNVLTEYNNSIGEKENCIIEMKIPLIDFKDGKHIIPSKTDVCCWWCTYNFETIPVYIPELYHSETFYVFGCFCSFNCAAAYNLNMNDYKIKDRHSLLMNMAINVYKKNIDLEIFIAPQREVLEKFGGPVGIIEFRKNFKSCAKEYRLILPPMASIIPTIEIITREKIIFGKHDANKFSQNTATEEKFGIFDSMGLKMRKKN